MLKKFEVAIRVFTVVEARDEAHAQSLATENLVDCIHNYGEQDSRVLATSIDDISVLLWDDEDSKAVESGPEAVSKVTP